MPIREVLTYPDPFLKRAVPETDPHDPRLAALFQDLVDTLRSHIGGVGLASPQIGEPFRAIVVDVTSSPRGGSCHGLLQLVDPRVTTASQWKKGREGCMSLPRLLGNIKRAQKIHVEAFDDQGEKVALDCEGYEAVAVQHEIDHLDGILFPDRVKSAADLVERRSPVGDPTVATEGRAKAVLFDLDATLLDDASAVAEGWTAFRAACEADGFGGDWDRLRKGHEGCAWREWSLGERDDRHDPAVEMLTRAWEATLAEEPRPQFPAPRALAERFLACMEAAWRLYDDVPGALDALKGRARLGIVTNGGTAFQRRKYGRLGLDRWFDSFTTSESAASSKPDRGIFLTACRSLGVEPKDAVMVGDRLDRDVVGALGAGLGAVWLDRSGTEAVMPPGAVRIRSLSELGEALARLGG